jgi:hypothetical protein
MKTTPGQRELNSQTLRKTLRKTVVLSGGVEYTESDFDLGNSEGGYIAQGGRSCDF